MKRSDGKHTGTGPAAAGETATIRIAKMQTTAAVVIALSPQWSPWLMEKLDLLLNLLARSLS